MTLLINLKRTGLYRGISPEHLNFFTEFFTLLANKFIPKEIKFYMRYPDELDGELIFHKEIQNYEELKNILTFSFVRDTLKLNRILEFQDYIEKIREFNIKIEGSFILGSKSYRSYILIYSERLSQLYGNFLIDIYANEEYYSLFHAILSENPEFLNQVEEHFLKRDLSFNNLAKNCFLIDGSSDKDFPFNTRYFYYDSPVNYVNDAFIDIYKQEEVNRKHLIPVKNFIAKHIAISHTFRDYLIEEGKSVGLVAIGGSLSIKVVSENAVEKMYQKIYSRIDSFIKKLPSTDYLEEEIDKAFSKESH